MFEKGVPRGPKQSRKARKFHLDHLLLKMLIDKGFTREALSRTLGMTTNTFKIHINHPTSHLTIDQLIIISGLLQVPLYEVVGIAVGMSRKESKCWYEVKE